MEQPFKSNDSLTGPMIGAVVAGLSVGFFGGWFSLALAGHGGNPWPFILLFGPVMVIAKAVPDSPSGAMVLIGACAGLFAVYFAVSTQLVWKPNPRARRLAILTLGMHVVCVGYALAFTPDLFQKANPENTQKRFGKGGRRAGLRFLRASPTLSSQPRAALTGFQYRRSNTACPTQEFAGRSRFARRS